MFELALRKSAELRARPDPFSLNAEADTRPLTDTQGVLAITNQRAAFLGSRKTFDMPYAKLMGMKLYSDGISFSLSNRQTSPLLRLGVDPEVIAALLNAAIQAADAY